TGAKRSSRKSFGIIAAAARPPGAPIAGKPGDRRGNEHQPFEFSTNEKCIRLVRQAHIPPAFSQ
ncbi:MAG TPA: hypothetical protein VMU71_01665, partial [Terracidiphilus sp.]|nr:hypothetical protein [Terracidiphilus sp.]